MNATVSTEYLARGTEIETVSCGGVGEAARRGEPVRAVAARPAHESSRRPLSHLIAVSERAPKLSSREPGDPGDASGLAGCA
jgi:hypothetical protein